MFTGRLEGALGTATIVDQVTFDADSCRQFLPLVFLRRLAVRDRRHVHRVLLLKLCVLNLRQRLDRGDIRLFLNKARWGRLVVGARTPGSIVLWDFFQCVDWRLAEVTPYVGLTLGLVV